MAQRAAGFAKKPPTARGERVGHPARGEADRQAVALKIAPLLAPYRKHGRLALRIERMPQSARLSAGRNNGNNSWSLTLDDLDGLTYLMPEGMDEPHVLAVRVIGIDEEGSTLAVIELPVSLDTIEADADTVDPRDEEYLRELSAELTKVKGLLATREAELARQRSKQSDVAGVRDAIDAELTSARTAWKLELDQRLATAAREAAAALKKHEAAWQEEHSKRVTESEERTQSRIVEARERWRGEAKTAMVKAETVWRAEEATRLAAAEAQWREKLANAQGRPAKAGDDTALNRAKDDLAAAQNRVTSLEKALADAKANTEQAQARWRANSEALLESAENGWKADEARRLATAEKAWQQKSESALVAANERVARAEAALTRAQGEIDRASKNTVDPSDVERVRAELATAQATIKERDAALARAQSEAERARAAASNTFELDALRSKLAAAEATNAEQRTALARAQSDAEHARATPSTTSELDSLRRELAEAQAINTEQRAALVRAQGDAERARADACDTTERDNLRHELSVALATVAEREAMLEMARAGAPDNSNGASDNEALRSELAAALTKLADKDAALVQAQAQAGSEIEKATSDALRRELDGARQQTSERDGQLTQLRDHIARMSSAEVQNIAAAVAEARTVWGAGEAERLAAAQSHWRDDAAITALEAKARYEAAEAALAQLRLRAERDSSGEFGDARFRDKLAALQAALTARENELGYARTLLEKHKILTPNSDLQALARRAADGKPARSFEIPQAKLIVEIAFAAFLAVAAFIYLPRAIGLLPYEWQESIFDAETQLQSALGTPPAAPARTGKVAVNAAKDAVATLTHGANIRTSPSQKAAVVVTLAAGTAVTATETQGNWTHVTLSDGKQTGWVFSAYLQTAGKDAPAKRKPRARRH